MTWLIIVGVSVAGVLAAAVLYNNVLSSQGDRIQQQDIPCVMTTGTGTAMQLTSGTLNTAGECT